jgi:hypothetical protein
VTAVRLEAAEAFRFVGCSERSVTTRPAGGGHNVRPNRNATTSSTASARNGTVLAEEILEGLIHTP